MEKQTSESTASELIETSQVLLTSNLVVPTSLPTHPLPPIPIGVPPISHTNDNSDDDSDAEENDEEPSHPHETKFIPEGKKDGEPEKERRGGRRKINIEFIDNKSRRHVTFSKRKAGLIKKAYELSTLTGTQVLLLIASETGNVYTFATPKLQALITKNEGKTLIQSCLNPESGADASQSPTTATPSRMISQDPSTNKQHTSAFKESYAKETREMKNNMSNSLSELNYSSYGSPPNGSNHNLAIPQSNVPMYTYPMTIGGFVPPPQSARYTYAHPNFPQNNQYSYGMVSSPNQAPSNLPPNQFNSYLYQGANTNQFSEASKEQL